MDCFPRTSSISVDNNVIHVLHCSLWFSSNRRPSTVHGALIIIIITMTTFMVLSSWHSHCESSPGSFDECRLSAGWPPTLRPNRPIWAVSPPIGYYHPQTPSPFIIITQLVSWYSFYRPTEGGRLSRPRHCSKGDHLVDKWKRKNGPSEKVMSVRHVPLFCLDEWIYDHAVFSFR